MTDVEAVTTYGESFYIEVSNNVWKEVCCVTAGPEIGRSPNRLDATHLKSTIHTYEDGIPDYSGDLQWTCNAIPSGQENSNIDLIRGLVKGKAYRVKRVLPQINTQIILWGKIDGKIGASSVDQILEFVITVTPTSDFFESTINENYSVTYDANGGTGTMTDSTSYAPGADVTILANTFTREGFAFTGWSTRADGTGATYDAEETFRIIGDTTLYAQWIDDTQDGE